jgi:hypothetical protein
MSAGSSPDIPLDAVVIKQYVAEVAEHLQPDGERRVLVVVGGALLAWHGLRDTTRDVDSVRPLDEELKAAVAAVAERHGLAATWLNDRAASFLREDECTVLLDHPALHVLGAPLDQVFLMKLYAAVLRTLRILKPSGPYVRSSRPSTRSLHFTMRIRISNRTST